MAPVRVNTPVEGSYNSALAKGLLKPPGIPPAIKTLPLSSRVAVCAARGVFMLLVGMNVPGDCARADTTALAKSRTRRLFISPSYFSQA